MAEDRKWKEAVQMVLKEAGEALHYTEITGRILEQGLRTKVGATPERTVNNTLRQSPDIFTPLDKKGMYGLQQGTGVTVITEQEEAEGVTVSLGMFWERSDVLWDGTPGLCGVFSSVSGRVSSNTKQVEVDFCEQNGVYLLHDDREIIYVGVATKDSLGKRLDAHTKDRMWNRWNRFSWAGFRKVSEENGTLEPKVDVLPDEFGQEHLILLLEAILIETLDPRMNKKSGDWMKVGSSLERYQQVPDPQLLKHERKFSRRR